MHGLSGVTSVDDARFRATFERVYGRHRALRSVPWLVVAGNHDHVGNVSAQVAYSDAARGRMRWRMPAEFYARQVALADGALVHFVFLDSSLLNAEHMQRPHALVARRYAPWLAAHRQSRWLNATLARAAAADWLIVVAHHPLMGAAEYSGFEPVVRWLQPLLERHRAALYLNGHTHTLQHLRHNFIDYFCIGNGASSNLQRWNWFNVPLGALRFLYPDATNADQTAVGKFTRTGEGGGFGDLTIFNRTHLRVELFDALGNVLHTLWKRNPRLQNDES